MRSIVSDEQCCYICKTTQNLQVHHLIPGYGRRQLSDVFGLTVCLCAKCHQRVHLNHGSELRLRQIGQAAWEEKYGTREEFIGVFGRSWL